jgi:hypothetical protein
VLEAKFAKLLPLNRTLKAMNYRNEMMELWNYGISLTLEWDSLSVF